MKIIRKITIPVFILLLIGGFLVWRHDIFGSRTTISKLPASSGSLNDFYQESRQLSSQNQTTPAAATTTFLAVGDIMLSRYAAVDIQKSGNVDYPFLGMAGVLRSTDFNFANLEGPVAPAAKDEVIGGNSLVFGDPPQNLTGLKDYNFQIINLANNHAFDQGLAGVDATIKTLDGLGIAREGTGDNLDQAWTPAVVTSNGIKICFVGASFSSLNDGGKVTNNYVARIENTVMLKSAITTARQECDFVVATMHAGIEYTRTPNQAQINFAHTAIDDGADIVIGAHPHWEQPVEKYKGKYIFYSLGNFVFDQEFSEDTMEGLALKIQISNFKFQNAQTPGAANLSDIQGQRQPATLDSIELIPVIIQTAQPRPATAEETKTILNKIGQDQNVLYP